MIRRPIAVRLTLATLLVATSLTNPASAQTRFEKSHSSSEIMRDIKKLGVLGKVLYVAAHPDDENTRFIAYTTKERLFHSGYFSFTRGAGGQNLIGDQQAPLLGVIRTEELLQARRVDGAEQFFSRAIDFGYSKTAEETFQNWDRHQALADLVRVIRMFKPDILVTRFEPDTPGHGHHKASAILALEAFEKSGKATAFPEQIHQGLTPWSPTRLIHNMPHWLGKRYNSREDLLALELGSYLPGLGQSVGEISSQSRSMHKSQGFGTPAETGSIIEYFKHIAGDRAEIDIFDKIDTSWKRVSSNKTAQAIIEHIEDILRTFDPELPSTAIPKLLKLKTRISKLSQGHWVSLKLAEIDRIILDCAGLKIRSHLTPRLLHHGDQGEFTITITNRSDVAFTLRSITLLEHSSRHSLALPFNEPQVITLKRIIKKQIGLSTPYWLRKTSDSGMYSVSDNMLLGRPKAPSPFSPELTFTVGEQLIKARIPTYLYRKDPIQAEIVAEAAVVPPVSLEFKSGLAVVPGRAKKESIKLHGYGKAISGYLHLRGSSDFLVSPAKQNISFAKGESFKEASFTITPRGVGVRRGTLSAYFELGGEKFSDTVETLAFSHFPKQTVVYQKPIHLLSVPEIPSASIAYIPGSKDALPGLLREMGLQVTILGKEKALDLDFSSFDSIVLGIRALNTNSWLQELESKLLAYVKNGGNLIIQYNTINSFSRLYAKPWPHTLELSNARVTNENAEVSILNKEHPIFTTPFRIEPRDFSDWVQERGLYFAKSWSSEYSPLLAMKDSGEAIQKGSLLVSDYGEGHVVYTGLSFFRQLPRGVSGATKLFINIILHNKRISFREE